MSVECHHAAEKASSLKGEQTCTNCNGTGKVKSVNLIGMSEEGPERPFSRRVLPEMQGRRKDPDTGKVPGLRRHGKSTDVRDLRQAVAPGTGNMQQLQEHIPRSTSSAAACDVSDLEPGKIYVGKVANLADFGVFVNFE